MASGTKVADVFIDIGYDFKKYQAGLAQAKKEAESLGSQIRTALLNPAGFSGRSGIAGLIADLRLGRGLLSSFQGNLPGIGRDLAKLSVSGLTSGLNALQGVGVRVFGTLRNLAGQVTKGFLLGAGISGFLALEQVVERVTHAIPELVNRGKDYAEAVHTITLETGANSEAVSRNLAIYQFLGGTQDQFGTQVVRLAARIKANESVLNSYGVVTRTVNGDLLDQITLVENLRSVFTRLPDGAEKTAIAFKLFGQRGAQAFGPLIHFLGLTDEQYTKLADDVTAQGLVVTDSTIKTADEVDKAWSRIQNAITGVATQLFAAVGPGITAFFDTLAEAITRNAKQIEDTLGSILTTVIGFVEGILGISPSLESFSAQFPRIDEGGANTSATLVGLQNELDALKKKLSPARDAASAFNATIEAGVKSLDKQIASVDRNVARITRLADIELAAYKKVNAALQTRIDLETQQLDAEERRISREETAAGLTRDKAQANIDLANAQAKLVKDQVQAQHDLAEAQAKGGDAFAAAQADVQETLDRDTIAISDAAQRVRDIQQNIGDEARHNATEDRKVQIDNLKAYVSDVEKIVTDSENKKAALTTLTKRKTVLEDEIAKAKASGNVQEAADLAIKLAAVEAGIVEENKKIKSGAAVDELTARKKQLEDQKAALQAERTSEAAINAEATKKAIAEKEKEIAAEKRRIAQDTKGHLETARQRAEDLESLTKAYGKAGLVPKLFEESRLAGVKFAEDVKKAIGELMDLVLGPEGKGGARTGGLVGGFRDIAGGVGNIGAALEKIVPGQGLLVAAAAALIIFGGPVGVGFGLGLLSYAGIKSIQTSLNDHTLPTKDSGGYDIPQKFGAKEQALLDAAWARRDPSYRDPITDETDQDLIRRLTGTTPPRTPKDYKTEPPLLGSPPVKPFRPYAAGGMIPGSPGQMVPINAHGGEYVVDRDLTIRWNRFLDRFPVFQPPSGPQLLEAGNVSIVTHVHVDNGPTFERLFGGGRFLDYIDNGLSKKTKR